MRAASQRCMRGVASRGRRRLRVGPLQPELHVHLSVHRRCRGEVLLSLLKLAHSAVEPPEAEVAVGDEGAHAEFVRQHPGCALVTSGFPRVQCSAVKCDLAEDMKGPCLMTPLALRSSHVDGTMSRGKRFLAPASKQMRLGEKGESAGAPRLIP